MSNPGEGSHNPPEPPLDIEDPRLVDVIVEDLKSQGVFDKIRAECIGEVDTKVGKKKYYFSWSGWNKWFGLVNYVAKTQIKPIQQGNAIRIRLINHTLLTLYTQYDL